MGMKRKSRVLSIGSFALHTKMFFFFAGVQDALRLAETGFLTWSLTTVAHCRMTGMPVWVVVDGSTDRVVSLCIVLVVARSLQRCDLMPSILLVHFASCCHGIVE